MGGFFEFLNEFLSEKRNWFLALVVVVFVGTIASIGFYNYILTKRPDLPAVVYEIEATSEAAGMKKATVGVHIKRCCS